VPRFNALHSLRDKIIAQHVWSQQHLTPFFSSKATRVEMYASFSPCKKCCGLITDFISKHHGCCVIIAFSCVYRHHEEIHCAALRTLYLSGVVSRLAVFRFAEWRLLERYGHLTLSPDDKLKMHIWDVYWWYRLKQILNPVSYMSFNLLLFITLSRVVGKS